jgi:molybdenum-dependent DNA-binding transcriptional regulator ModE
MFRAREYRILRLLGSAGSVSRTVMGIDHPSRSVISTLGRFPRLASVALVEERQGMAGRSARSLDRPATISLIGVAGAMTVFALLDVGTS